MTRELAAAVDMYAGYMLDPAWEKHAVHQVRWWAKEHPCVFAKLPELVEQEVYERRERNARKGAPDAAA